MSNGATEIAGAEGLPGVSDDELAGVAGGNGYTAAAKVVAGKAARKVIPGVAIYDGVMSAKSGGEAGMKKYRETGSVRQGIVEGGKQAVGEFTGYNAVRDAFNE